MKHKAKIIEHVIDVISEDANLILDLIGEDMIGDIVEELDDDDIRYYFESGYTGYNHVEDLIDEIDAEQRR